MELQKFKNGDLSASEEQQLLGAAIEAVYAEELEKKLLSAGIKRNKPSAKLIWLRPLLAAAACAALFFSAWLFFAPNRQTPMQMADAQIEASVGQYDFQVRSSAGGNEAEWEKAFSAKKYSEALVGMERNAGSDKTLFYKGLAHLYLHDFKSAATEFEVVSQNHESPYQKDALWFLGLAALKNGQKETAKKALGEVAKMSGWAKAKDAQKMLEAF